MRTGRLVCIIACLMVIVGTWGWAAEPEYERTPPGPPALLADVVAATNAERQPRPCVVLMFDHWAYDAIQRLVDVGVVMPWPDGTFRGMPPWTRGLFAEYVRYVFDTSQERLRSTPGPHGHAARLDFCRLLQEFWPELRQLRPAARFRSQVEHILRTYPTLEPVASAAQSETPPFADVPRDHWAYQAVERLRQMGILIGCPGPNGERLFEG